MTYFLPQHLKKCESFAEIEREISLYLKRAQQSRSVHAVKGLG